MVENGAVRTYEGHSNTHTSLQMGVDPSETFLVSGNSNFGINNCYVLFAYIQLICS
jgi:hypothetical protein